MDNFDLANTYLNDEKFEFAADKFLKVINDDLHDFQQKDESYEKYLKIVALGLLEINHFDILVKYANFLSQHQKFKKAMPIFELIINVRNEKNSLETFENYIKCLITLNEIDSLSNFKNKYFKILSREYNTSKIKEYIKVYTLLDLADSSLQVSLLKAAVATGEINIIKEELDAEIDNFLGKRDGSLLSLLIVEYDFDYYDSFFYKIFNKWSFWKEYKACRSLVFIFIILWREKEIHLNNQQKKKMLSSFYDCLLFENNHKLEMLATLYCSEVFQVNFQTQDWSMISESNFMIFDEKVKSLTKQCLAYPTDRDDKIAENDFGYDLLRHRKDSITASTSDLIRLQNECMLLIKTGHLKKAEEKLQEIIEIDPDSKFSRNEIYANLEKTIDNGVNTECLLKEIDQFSFKIDDQLQSIEEKNIINFFKLSKINESDKIYYDLVVCYIEMDLLDVAKYLLNKIKPSKNNVLDLVYFEFTLFYKSKKYLDAISLVEKTIDENVMNSSDNICFLYLKAEALRAIGAKREALAIYLYIKKIVRTYRLSSQRINELG